MTPVRFHSDTRTKECAPLQGEAAPRLLIYGNPLPNNAKYSIAEFQKNGTSLTIQGTSVQVVEALELGIGAYFERVEHAEFENAFDIENLIEGCLYIRICGTRAKAIYRAIGSQVIWYDLTDTITTYSSGGGVSTHYGSGGASVSRPYQNTTTPVNASDYPNFQNPFFTKEEKDALEKFNQHFQFTTNEAGEEEERKNYTIPASEVITYAGKNFNEFNERILIALMSSRLVQAGNEDEILGTLILETPKDHLAKINLLEFTASLTEASWFVSENNAALRKSAKDALTKDGIEYKNFFEKIIDQNIKAAIAEKDRKNPEIVAEFIIEKINQKEISNECKSICTILKILQESNNFIFDEKIVEELKKLNTKDIKIPEPFLNFTLEKFLEEYAGTYVQDKIKKYVEKQTSKQNLEKDEFLNFLSTLPCITFNMLRYALNSTHTRAMNKEDKEEIIQKTNLSLTQEEIQSLIPNKTERANKNETLYSLKPVKIAKDLDAPLITDIFGGNKSTNVITHDQKDRIIQTVKSTPAKAEIAEIINEIRRLSQEKTGLFDIKPAQNILEFYTLKFYKQSEDEQNKNAPYCTNVIEALIRMGYYFSEIKMIGTGNLAISHVGMKFNKFINEEIKLFVEKNKTPETQPTTEQINPSKIGLHYEFKRELSKKNFLLSDFKRDVFPFIERHKDTISFEELAAIIAQESATSLSLGEIYEIVALSFKNFKFSEDYIKQIMDYNDNDKEELAYRIADQKVCPKTTTATTNTVALVSEDNTKTTALPETLVNLIKKSKTTRDFADYLIDYFGTARLTPKEIIEAYKINPIGTTSAILNGFPSVKWNAEEISELQREHNKQKESVLKDHKNETILPQLSPNQPHEVPEEFKSLSNFIAYCQSMPSMSKESFLNLYKVLLKHYIPSITETYNIFNIKFTWEWDEITMNAVLYENPHYINSLAGL